jgi:hypothetical protein
MGFSMRAFPIPRTNFRDRCESSLLRIDDKNNDVEAKPSCLAVIANWRCDVVWKTSWDADGRERIERRIGDRIRVTVLCDELIFHWSVLIERGQIGSFREWVRGDALDCDMAMFLAEENALFTLKAIEEFEDEDGIWRENHYICGEPRPANRPRLPRKPSRKFFKV